MQTSSISNVPDGGDLNIFDAMDYHIPLLPNGCYHVLSHAVGTENIFREPDNYSYFLNRYLHHIAPVADTFAYNLLPNHFHFLLRVKAEQTLLAHYQSVKDRPCTEPALLPDFAMERFSNWLNGYSKAYNKRYKRRGALFIDYLRRVEVPDDDRMAGTIWYIHRNAAHHGIRDNLFDWPYSSVHHYLSDGPTNLVRTEGRALFGSRENFMEIHSQVVCKRPVVQLE